MKSKKLLIGLIVAAFVGGVHFASAQSKANFQNNLIEIGPDNIGGRVRAIIVDQADPKHQTLYAGGVAGGLFRMNNSSWQYLPCYTNNQEVTLPISCMIQLPDNSLLIGTGEGIVDNHGNNDNRMSPKGRGVYRFNPADNSFTLLSNTNPVVNPDWTYVNRMAVLERNNYWFIYAATNEGLYRWKLDANNPSWSSAATKVVSGQFQDVIILSADNVAYASAPGKLYRIGNVTGESGAVDVTSTNSAFATSSRIELAGLTSHAANDNGGYDHNTYLYAMVSNAYGLLDGVYLTHDQQNWSLLTTATVAPFNSDNPGYLNSAITINPRNYKEIYIAGATMWSGEGYVENSYYQWAKQTSSENELNYGNYMGTVFYDNYFVHSGIHQMVTDWTITESGDTSWITYFATDGGIYKGTTTYVAGETMWSFRSINKGFNTVQYNHIAVSPDGSVIGGAIDNSCPFIQTRNDHNGGLNDTTWYDPDGSIMNHMSNVIWFGDGGDVAASMFQQLAPYTRRYVFVSSPANMFTYIGNNSSVISCASFGRAMSDYNDFNNTQTWTVGPSFLAGSIRGNNPIPKMDLWETTSDSVWNETITFNIDTNLTYIHNGVETPISGSTVFRIGDSILVASKSCADYPFYHKFTEPYEIRKVIAYKDSTIVNGNLVVTDTFRVEYELSYTVHNPVVSRMILSARNAQGSGSVYMSLYPADFRKVWTYEDFVGKDETKKDKLMWWPALYNCDPGYSVGDVAFSHDGKSVFAVISNDTTGRSYVMRIYDFTNADANHALVMKDQLGYQPDRPDYPDNPRITHFDTIMAIDGNMFKRPISSLVVDPRDGEDNLIITFGGYGNSNEPNMLYVKNATDTSSRQITALNVVNGANSMAVTDPVYSAIIECTTGTIYAGTEKGVFTNSSTTSSNWEVYGSFNGVPVTSIVQQTRNMPRESYMARDGVNDVKYLFAKTKYPYAIYFGTYGRGVFMDTTYVTDHANEVCDSTDWLGITTVDNGENSVSVFPNPASVQANVELSVVNPGNAVIMIYDINGKLVHSESLGYLGEGLHRYSLDCQKFNHGMYLVNINIGKESATSKLIVR